MTTDVLERTDTKISINDESYVVIFYNDNKTSFEFVIFCLMEIFTYTFENAQEMAMKIHQNHNSVVAQYNNIEIAEQKVSEVVELATAYGYPLKVTYEKS